MGESEARKIAALKKISEQVEKQLENAQASLRKLLKQEYACIADAEIGIKCYQIRGNITK